MFKLKGTYNNIKVRKIIEYVFWFGWYLGVCGEVIKDEFYLYSEEIEIGFCFKGEEGI